MVRSCHKMCDKKQDYLPTRERNELRYCLKRTRFRFTNDHIAKEEDMLSWTVVFLVIALVAALLGFGGIAGAATGIAKILFFVFLIAFIVSLALGRRPVA